MSDWRCNSLDVARLCVCNIGLHCKHPNHQRAHTSTCTPPARRVNAPRVDLQPGIVSVMNGQQYISAVERMRKLLSAPDKKAMILEMAEVSPGVCACGCWVWGCTEVTPRRVQHPKPWRGCSSPSPVLCGRSPTHRVLTRAHTPVEPVKPQNHRRMRSTRRCWTCCSKTSPRRARRGRRSRQSSWRRSGRQR